MSHYDYQQAIKCCNDALSYINPKDDPVMWNLTGALKEIAVGLQQDIENLERQIESIHRGIQHIEHLAKR